jgi:tetratricopeptide (TPR) repeat protein
MARWMVDINPKSPKRRSSLIRLDWDESQDDIDRWLEKYGHHPAVVGALGDQYYAHGEMEKAEAMYRKYIELAPEYNAYRVLASLQYRRGELQEALATAEKFLEAEDFGLSHARMQQRAARTLMAEGDYVAAMKWAEGSAQSYSAWGLLTLAECLERQGEFEECLRVLHAIDERYGNHLAYYFVARTGRGDLAEEFRRARADYVRKYGEGSAAVKNREAWHTFFSGDYAAAAPLLEKSYQDELSNDLYLVAFAAEKGNDKAMRDRVLGRVKEALEKSDSADKEGIQIYLTMLNSLLTGEKVDPALGEGTSWASSSAFYRFHFLLGWCHEHAGDRESAIKHYTLAATGDERDDREAIIAWREMVRLGVDPQKLKFRYTTF